MKAKKKRTAGFFLLLSLLCLAAGCGRSGGGSSGTESPPEETSVPEETTAGETEGAAGETEGTAGETEGSGIVTITIPGLDSTEQEGEGSEDETEPVRQTRSDGKETFASTGMPAVALTFDDGPRQGSTDTILDILEEYNVPATFFIVGSCVSQNPDALKREVALGCELGSHTYNHNQLTNMSTSQIEEEMSSSIRAIEEASGGTVTVMRPPYGAVNSDVKEAIDLPIIIWSVDTLDWKTRDPDSTLATVQEEVTGGSIILMHDIYEETAEAVAKIIPWLQRQDYKLLTVTQLYEYYEEDLTLHTSHGSTG